MQIEQDDLIITKQPKKSNGTAPKVIMMFIVITIIAVIAIIFAIMNIQNRKLSVTIDGLKVNFKEDTFVFTENRKDLCINKGYSTTY